MRYQIIRTEKADEQIRDIIFYIADDSGSVEIALDYLNKMEMAINQLSDFPDMGSIPRYATLRRQGYRVLVVERHLAFYKVNHMTHVVTIYAVFDGKQEYRNLL